MTTTPCARSRNSLARLALLALGTTASLRIPTAAAHQEDDGTTIESTTIFTLDSSREGDWAAAAPFEGGVASLAVRTDAGSLFELTYENTYYMPISFSYELTVVAGELKPIKWDPAVALGPPCDAAAAAAAADDLCTSRTIVLPARSSGTLMTTPSTFEAEHRVALGVAPWGDYRAHYDGTPLAPPLKDAKVLDVVGPWYAGWHDGAPILDIACAPGEFVYAARDGVVAAVRSTASSHACDVAGFEDDTAAAPLESARCADDTLPNSVSVLHCDGTRATYAGLLGLVAVAVGDRVEARGAPLGYCGSVLSVAVEKAVLPVVDKTDKAALLAELGKDGPRPSADATGKTEKAGLLEELGKDGTPEAAANATTTVDKADLLAELGKDGTPPAASEAAADNATTVDKADLLEELGKDGSPPPAEVTVDKASLLAELGKGTTPDWTTVVRNKLYVESAFGCQSCDDPFDPATDDKWVVSPKCDSGIEAKLHGFGCKGVSPHDCAEPADEATTSSKSTKNKAAAQVVVAVAALAVVVALAAGLACCKCRRLAASAKVGTKATASSDAAAKPKDLAEHDAEADLAGATSPEQEEQQLKTTSIEV